MSREEEAPRKVGERRTKDVKGGRERGREQVRQAGK